MSGRARRPPAMSLEDARAMVLSGVGFADVLSQVDSADHAQLRQWFVTDDAVTLARRRSFEASNLPAGSTYDTCRKCGSITVQTGSCRTCQSCGDNEGCG